VADSGARLHRLRIALDETPLRLGTLVEVRLIGEAAPLLTLPRDAVLETGAAPQVWRIAPDRRLEAVTVKTGPEIDGRIIIRDGLKEGDEVLVRGIHAASPGATVGQRIAQ